MKPSPRTADFVAGVSVAGLLVPEAIAYAGIAGVAPAHALIASIAGTAIYACAGRSTVAVVSPTSASATIIAAASAALAASSPGAIDAGLWVSALVLAAAVLFLFASLARLGHFAALISRPVLHGFAFGLAVTIVIHQLPAVAGVTATGASTMEVLFNLLRQAAQWNPWTVVLGIAAYAGLRLLRRIAMFPAALAVLVAGIAATALFDLPAHGVATVGTLALAWPHFALPRLGNQEWLSVFEVAVPLVVILYAESWGSIRSLSLRRGEAVEPNRELAALGAANLLSGALQGLPVGAGFSASSANDDAGARSRLAGAVAAVAVAVIALFGARWLALLPVAVLAAVVASALTHALNPKPLLALHRLKRDEFLAACAVLGVIVAGVLPGMLFAVLLSVLATARRVAQARVTVLGRLGETHDYVDALRNPQAVQVSDVLVVRPEEPLFFANAESALAEIRRIAQRQPAVKVVVVSLEESADLDSTAVEVLGEFRQWLRANGLALRLARVKDDARELLARAAPRDPFDCFWSVDDAVAAPRYSLTEPVIPAT